MLDGQLLLSVHSSIHWSNCSSFSVSLLAHEPSENFPLYLLILSELYNPTYPSIYLATYEISTTHSQIHLFIHPYLPIQLPILPFTYPQGHSSIHHVSKFRLSIHSPIHPLIYQSNHLSKHLFILLFSYPHSQPSINIFTELSTHPST